MGPTRKQSAAGARRMEASASIDGLGGTFIELPTRENQNGRMALECSSKKFGSLYPEIDTAVLNCGNR